MKKAMQKTLKLASFFIVLTMGIFYACNNKEVNEGEEFRPRQLHDDFQNSHFTKINVEGVEYLIMERDNNNPHEGFGFMAFNANKLMLKQDTILSYLKTIAEFQSRLYKKLYDVPTKTAKQEFNSIFLKNLPKDKIIKTNNKNKKPS